MAMIFRMSYFRKTAILLLILAGFAALFPGSLHVLFATATSLPSQGVNGELKEGERTIAQLASDPGAQANMNDSAQSPPLTEKQRRNLMKANFEKMKRDAGELADLAKALHDELNKSNENILSLDIVDKADKIEKLARKIKTTARGY